MTRTSRSEIRVRLAEGHWDLGEHEEAVDSIERGLSEDSEHAGLVMLIERLCVEAADGSAPAEIEGRLKRLARLVHEASPMPGSEHAKPERAEEEDLPPLATVTLAELLAEQGRPDKAVRVAHDVLERNPTDERARTLVARLTDEDRGEGRDRRRARLKLWLRTVQRRRAEGGLYT